MRDDALAPGAPVVAPVREEAVRVAGRAEVGAVDALDACCAQGALGRRPEVELAVLDDVVAERLPERGRHLVADLVATGADARADRGREAPRPQRPRARPDDAC